MRRFPAFIGSLLVILLLLACNGDGGKPPEVRLDLAQGQTLDLTLEGFYDRLAQATTREGFVFHTAVDYYVRGGSPDCSGHAFTREAWVDLENQRARLESRLDLDYIRSCETDSAANVSLIIIGNDGYVRQGDRGPNSRCRDRDPEFCLSDSSGQDPDFCPGTNSALLSVILECGGSPQIFRYSSLSYPSPCGGGPFPCAPVRIVGSLKFNGDAAIAAIWTPESSQSESMVAFYVDPEDFLPKAWVIERVQGMDIVFYSVGTHDNEFIKAQSLPDDFFDPASIGYTYRP